MKPHIPVTLVSIDTTSKSHLAARAIQKCLDQATFDDVKLLTTDMKLPHAIKIPELKGLGAYSDFCIRHLEKFVNTSHVLIVQADGYILDANKWNEGFLDFDYIGAPFQPSNTVGNGGFSLRSRKLLEVLSKQNWTDNHPEDSAICIRHRAELEAAGIQIAPAEIARLFSFEGRAWDGGEWKSQPTAWSGSFGFHSFLTVLPKGVAPIVAHHSGDSGDTIYAMATFKKLGCNVLFLSPDNKFPFPIPTRWTREGGAAQWVDNLAPLIEHQDYVWSCKYTHGTPFSTTHDLNKFRTSWGTKKPDFDSIYKLHGKVFGVDLDDNEPWLTVKEPISFPKFPIVVGRTPRYRNDDFDWPGLVTKYGDRMVFVGNSDEHMNFNGFAAPNKIPHYKTGNMLDLARVIAGAKVCIMNQSSPLAIAHGLGKRVIVEEWKLNPNCRLIRPDALYSMGGKLDIPADWLK